MKMQLPDGTQTVTVELGERSYPIHIGSGLLEMAGQLIAEKKPGSRCAIITDTNVFSKHGDMLTSSLEDAGIEYSLVKIMPGEQSKSLASFNDVISRLIETRYDRNDLVLAFGGGVVGDLAGFAAAVARRGMDFVQIPTSLLAQVDSSVGGKTGINAPQGKNLIGAFHQPVLVIADTNVLKSLPKREFAAGYAEIVKYGLINQPDFFQWLEENHEEIFSFDPALTEAIAQSCRSKAFVVSQDEREGGMRALLNLGHTFGHALEGAAGYDATRLVHGEGVAIGMVLAHRFSNAMNQCPVEDAERVAKHLDAVGLPTSINQIPDLDTGADALLQFMAQDKKANRGELVFILTKGLGKSYIARDVPASSVLNFLKEMVPS